MIRSAIISVAAATTILTPALAEQGDLLVRLRGIVVAPTEDIGGVQPTFPNGSASVDNAIVPELDFTYFFTDNIAAELILATSPHDLSGEGDLEGLGEIAELMVLPPTITLQYHFAPNAQIRPYVGVGVNFTVFYDIEASQSLVDAIGPTNINVDESFGVAFQAGVDYMINDRWSINADIKYIQIDTDATLDTGGLINTLAIDLDPVVAGIGVGYRF